MNPNDPDLLTEAPSTMDDDIGGLDSTTGVPFPVVGVGASAGGLEAFTQLLKSLPADTGMAFVLVQHLAPTHVSALAEILSRATRMPVTEVRDEPIVEPNHIYVIPPDRSMIIVKGALQLLPRASRGAPHPIDQFFRSLAVEQRHRAIGVVLSGTATDGTLGLADRKRSVPIGTCLRSRTPSTRSILKSRVPIRGTATFRCIMVESKDRA